MPPTRDVPRPRDGPRAGEMCERTRLVRRSVNATTGKQAASRDDRFGRERARVMLAGTRGWFIRQKVHRPPPPGTFPKALASKKRRSCVRHKSNHVSVFTPSLCISPAPFAAASIPLGARRMSARAMTPTSLQCVSSASARARACPGARPRWTKPTPPRAQPWPSADEGSARRAHATPPPRARPPPSTRPRAASSPALVAAASRTTFLAASPPSGTGTGPLRPRSARVSRRTRW